MERAAEEAMLLIENEQLWVHTARKDNDAEEHIASIVAVTRVSESVAGITKVFTAGQWRANGCTERLVREVCRQ